VTTHAASMLQPMHHDRMRLLTTQDGLPRLSWESVIAGIILSLECVQGKGNRSAASAMP
jgi:hypothetical protein